MTKGFRRNVGTLSFLVRHQCPLRSIFHVRVACSSIIFKLYTSKVSESYRRLLQYTTFLRLSGANVLAKKGRHFPEIAQEAPVYGPLAVILPGTGVLATRQPLLARKGKGVGLTGGRVVIEDDEDVFARIEFLQRSKRRAARDESSVVRKSIENLAEMRRGSAPCRISRHSARLCITDA
jgi:hypothetical protein